MLRGRDPCERIPVLRSEKGCSTLPMMPRAGSEPCAPGWVPCGTGEPGPTQAPFVIVLVHGLSPGPRTGSSETDYRWLIGNRRACRGGHAASSVCGSIGVQAGCLDA